jgi:DNA-binding transcriptional LysR family regulator
MRPRKANHSLDWDDFRYFLAVFRTGTLSGASLSLDVDQATVSRRIDKLETALKTRLFKRGVTGYQPTATGSNLLAAVEAMETAALSAKADASTSEQSPRVVRIGAPDGFGSMFLAPRLGLLCDAHPNLQIELVATARSFSLTKREADIAFSLNRPQRGRIVFRKLTDYQLGLYASRDYLAAHPPIRDTRELRTHDFIGYIEDLLFTPELNYLPAVAKNLEARIRSGNLIAQLNACLAGAGLAILPTFMTADQPRLERVLADRVSLMRTFYMQMHEDSQKIAQIQDTAKFIMQQVRINRHLFMP